MRLLSGVLLVLACFPGCRGAAKIAPTVPYVDPAHGFSLQVPTGWAASPADHFVMHYRDVVFAANSLGREDLRVQDEQHVGGSEYSDRTVVRQLAPGTAYVDLGHFGGPGCQAYYGRNREDSVGATLVPLLDRLEWHVSDDGALRSTEVSFLKWGESWSLFVFLREPISPETCRATMALLRSFRFEEHPRENASWAVGVAWRALPPEAEPETPWPIHDGAQWGYHRTTARKSEGGFFITFDHLGEDLATPVRSWRFLVTPDGSAIPR